MTKKKAPPCPFAEHAADLKRIQDTLKGYVEVWRVRLGVDDWDIEFIFHLGMCMDTPDCAGRSSSDWKYKHGHIDFYLGQVTLMPESDWEMLVVHELLHVVVNEMQCADGDLAHEERVVTELTRAFLRLARE